MRSIEQINQAKNGGISEDPFIRMNTRRNKKRPVRLHGTGLFLCCWLYCFSCASFFRGGVCVRTLKIKIGAILCVFSDIRFKIKNQKKIFKKALYWKRFPLPVPDKIKPNLQRRGGFTTYGG